jgi:hypothetical protein
MSRYLADVLKELYNTALNQNSYDKDSNLALASFFAIGSLLENAAMDTKKTVEDFFVTIIGTFERTLQPGLFPNAEIRNDYQNYLASVIEAALVSEKITLDYTQGKHVLDLIINSFKQRECVYEEGLLAASSIALSEWVDITL